METQRAGRVLPLFQVQQQLFRCPRLFKLHADPQQAHRASAPFPGLGEQGLVVSQPQQGFQVIPLSREDLLDLTSTRLDIETLALRRSVQRGDVEWRAQLMAAQYRLSNTPQHLPDDPSALSEDWARAHQEFHHLLLAACGSKRLLDIAENLRDSAEVYRRWSSPMPGSATRDIAGEHRAIMAAVEAGDEDLAVQALASHIAHTTDVLLQGAG